MEEYPKKTGEKEDGLDVVEWTSWDTDILPQIKDAVDNQQGSGPKTISINDRIALGDAWLRMEDRAKSNPNYAMRDYSNLNADGILAMLNSAEVSVDPLNQEMQQAIIDQRELINLANDTLGGNYVGIIA